jgi:hypothetical protein
MIICFGRFSVVSVPIPVSFPEAGNKLSARHLPIGEKANDSLRRSRGSGGAKGVAAILADSAVSYFGFVHGKFRASGVF